MLAAHATEFGSCAAAERPSASPLSEPTRAEEKVQALALPAGTTTFSNATVLIRMIGEQRHKTALTPTNLDARPLRLTTDRALVGEEAAEVIDIFLQLRGIALVDVSERYLKGVPAIHPAPVFSAEPWPFETYVVALTNRTPSELVPKLKLVVPPTIDGLRPLDNRGLLLMCDQPDIVRRMVAYVHAEPSL